MWFLKTHLPVEKKVAVITGASQGLGVELATQLYKQNCSVILVARREAKLVQQVETIKNEHGVKEGVFIDYLTANTSDYDACVELWKEIWTRGYDPDYFFACAGGATCKLFTDLTKDELATGVNSNYLSTLNAVHTWTKQVQGKNSGKEGKGYKNRHIVIFSSVAAVYPLIGYSQYAPLKSALMSLSLTLRQELSPFNYRVSCVFPGNFASEGYEEEERTKPSITKKIEGSSVPITVTKCAEIVLGTLDRGYDTVYTDLIGWVLGSASLGAYPRVLSFFQVIISLIFSILAPFISLFIDADIRGFYRDSRKRE